MNSVHGSNTISDQFCTSPALKFRYFRVGPQQSFQQEVLLGDITYDGVYEIYDAQTRLLGLYRCLVPYLFMEIDSDLRTTPPRFLHVQTGEWFDVEKQSDGNFQVTNLSFLNQ